VSAAALPLGPRCWRATVSSISAPTGNTRVERRTTTNNSTAGGVDDAASFVMRLYTTDRSQGGTFDVLAAPVEGDADTALIAKYSGKDDVTKCLNAMMSGKEMTFMLADQKETLVDFLLPSDQAFKGLYDETCTRLAEFEIASELLRSHSDDVRKSPKDYEVWMVRTKSRYKFHVLLVKLDTEGKFDEAFAAGTFSSRTEQETFALEVARDFQIKLN
jgi:hypothetical protein